MKPAELRSDIKAGQSVADVAAAKGVSVDTVVADASAKIDQAVTNGKLTQAKADAAKAKLPAQVTKLVDAHHTAK